jgi:hypothetical protein
VLVHNTIIQNSLVGVERQKKIAEIFKILIIKNKFLFVLYKRFLLGSYFKPLKLRVLWQLKNKKKNKLKKNIYGRFVIAKNTSVKTLFKLKKLKQTYGKGLVLFLYYYYQMLCYRLFSAHLILIRKTLLGRIESLRYVKRLYKKIRFLRKKFTLYDILVLSHIVLSASNTFFILNYIGWQIYRKSFHSGYLKYFFIILRLLFYASGIIYGIRAVLTGPYNRHSRTKALI